MTTDSGNSATDHYTNSGALTVGNLESGASVQYSTDGGQTWTNSFSAVEGANTVAVRQVNVAGNVSAATMVNFALDNTADDISLTLHKDSGTSESDRITNDVVVNVNGLESSSSWQYSVDGGVHWTVGSGSSFELAKDHVYGADDVQVKSKDVAGNFFFKSLSDWPRLR